MITIQERQKVLEKAIDTYGKELQTTVFFEEVAELQKELCKNTRGKDNQDEITEEMADVYIMMEQLKIMYGIKDESINKIIDEKLDRLMSRMDQRKEDLDNGSK